MSYEKRPGFRALSIRASTARRRARLPFSPSRELEAALSVPLLEGEDAAAHRRLLDACIEAFKPLDAIEYIFVREFAEDTWAANRCKRMKVATANEAIIKSDRERPHKSIEEDPLCFGVQN
jgi:hypothetical protein